MALPKLETKTYTLTLPSTGEDIKYRPFLVKEQKTLMMAMDSKNDNEVVDAMSQLINDCTFGKVDPKVCPMFDAEYIFLRLRAKSVGEKAEISVVCPDDNETKVPVQVNLDDIKVITSEDHKRDIPLDGSLTMRMKYPAMGEFVKNNFNTDMQVDDTFDLVISCIEQVFSEEESWAASDCTKKELNEFLEQLDSNQFKKIEQFFETMPKLSHTIKVTNPKTKVVNNIVLEGLNAFFG